jgi:hypothetical protein
MKQCLAPGPLPDLQVPVIFTVFPPFHPLVLSTMPLTESLSQLLVTKVTHTHECYWKAAGVELRISGDLYNTGVAVYSLCDQSPLN